MGFMKLFHRCLPFRLPVLAAFSALLYAGHALAVEPFTVKDIRVEGIQRTEAGTVFNYLPVRVGDTFNDEKAVTAIRSLYATGFFKDVRIDAEGDILVVIVEEGERQGRLVLGEHVDVRRLHAVGTHEVENRAPHTVVARLADEVHGDPHAPQRDDAVEHRAARHRRRGLSVAEQYVENRFSDSNHFSFHSPDMS